MSTLLLGQMSIPGLHFRARNAEDWESILSKRSKLITLNSLRIPFSESNVVMERKIAMALAYRLVTLAVPQAQLSVNCLCCYTAFRGRNCISTTRCRFSPSVCFVRARDYHSQRDIFKDPISGVKLTRDKLWQDFFSDPSQWWDNRSKKANPKYPDFKQKKTQQGLWIIDNITPPWVEAELAIMAPRLFQPVSFSWNVRLRKHLKDKDYQKTLNLFQQMQLEGMIPDKFTFVTVLNACSSLGSLVEGRRVHDLIIHTGCRTDIYVENCLIDMYAKCGSIEDAWTVFNKMRRRDVVSWTAMIVGYVKSDQGLKALELFRVMQQDGVEPNTVTFVGALNACASVAALQEGSRIHEQIVRSRCQSDVRVANCLVDMYAKCGSMENAWIVFKRMPERSVVSWTAMIVGYVKAEQGLKALELYRQMQQEGVEPDAVTFVGTLNACSSVAALEEGRRVHVQIVRTGCQSDVRVSNCLVDMYAKCGSIGDAWIVFKKMRKRSVVSWTAMIVGYVKAEQGLKALELFRKLQQEGVEPDAVTFVGALNACAGLAALEEGRLVHKQIIRSGCQSNVYVANSLIDMYAKCGGIEDAWSVFNKISERDVVSWSAMIVGYVKSEQGQRALELFQEMRQEGVEPNSVTFVGVLNACASVIALDEGRCVHKQIIRGGCESDVYVATCLLGMYAKCGSIEDAWHVFNRMPKRSVVSWTTMIVGYVKSKQGLKALELFERMHQEGVEPDSAVFIGALNACAALAALEEGKRVHKQIIRKGCESDVYVATCLVDMYAKCGSIKDAWSVFNKMREHDVVSWTVMIVGYVKSEQGLKALELFRKMQQRGVEPNIVTFVGVLNACASVAALQEGRRVHKQIIQKRFESDVNIATCLVDMYAKCGSTKYARSVFNKMRERDVVSWSAMIGGYAMHGHSEKAFELFEQMGEEGVKINKITLICLLSACSHGGLVEKGLHYFNIMTSHYNVLPTSEHYVCMVDLLGRAGRLEEAWKMAEEMTDRIPMERDGCVWICLLSACRIHGNIKMAERAAKRCWELDPKNASAHVLLSNIYAAAGQWDSTVAIEEARLERKVRKVPGRTWIEVKNAMHSFVVDDEEHPEILQIYAEFDRLSVQLSEEGHIADRRFLPPEKVEECHLCRQ